MREDLESLLDDITLMTLALAIAIGWSLFNLSRGVADLVNGLLTHVSPSDSGLFASSVEWTIGHRILDLEGLLYGAIELAVALSAALLVVRRRASYER